jgi:hypothetical protein
MIKPPAPTEVPSPLDSFAATIALMGANRTLLAGLGVVLGEPEWRVLLEDLAMLTNERVVVGLRTPWVRRVAVPVLSAHKALQMREGTDQERARSAVEILKQCTDEHVQRVMVQWIQRKFHV